MITLFRRCIEQCLTRAVAARGHGLAFIQCLGTDFAGMIDPHQASGMTPLLIVQLSFFRILRRVVPCHYYIAR